MPQHHKRHGIAFNLADKRNRRIEFGVVLLNIAEFTHRFAFTVRTSVLVQVYRIEGIARGIHLFGKVPLEEIVIESVDIQDGRLAYKLVFQGSRITFHNSAVVIHRIARTGKRHTARTRAAIPHERRMVLRAVARLEWVDYERLSEERVYVLRHRQCGKKYKYSYKLHHNFHKVNKISMVTTTTKKIKPRMTPIFSRWR